LGIEEGGFLLYDGNTPLFVHRVYKEQAVELPFTFQDWWYLALSLVGLVVIGAALRSRRQAEASQSWLGTEGRVIDSRLEKRETTDGEGQVSISYKAIIRYTYTVMGQEFTGDRVSFGAMTSNRNPASEIVQRYPLDKRVMVYYDPGKPGQAVLERVSASGWVQILVGAALVVAGIYFSLA
jgi:hypothetical protein